MAEIIAEPSALSKVIPVSFKINDTDSVTTTRLATKKQFNTTDTDAWLSFTLDGIETTNGEFDLTLINVDENPSSIFHHTSIAFPGIPFHYKLDASEDLTKNEIRHAGRWIGQVIIRLANGDTTTRQFDFAIAGHLLDGKEARVILIEDYNALIATITASKTELEGYNIDYAALIADVDAKEALREQAEIDRAATFGALVESEMVAQNVATKLAEKEATFAPRMLSLESELAESVIKLTKLNRWVDVTERPFNAVGDGVTDDTAAIQAAIDYASTIGRKVYIPHTNYFYRVSIGVNGYAIKTTINTNIIGDRSILKISDADIASDTGAIIQVAGRYTNIDGLIVDCNLKAGYGIKTTDINTSLDGTYMPDLVIKRTDVLKSTNTGVALRSYLCTLEKVTVRDSNVGFLLARGTSFNLTVCYAVSCSYGFKVNSIYTNFNSCACDYADKVAYTFLDASRNVTLNSCGVENFTEKVIEAVNCWYITINNLSNPVLLKGYSYTDPIITFTNCIHCEIKNLRFNNIPTTPKSIIYQDSGYDLHVDAFIDPLDISVKYGDTNVYNPIKITGKCNNVKPSFDGYSQIDLTLSQFHGLINTQVQTGQQLQFVNMDVPLKLSITGLKDSISQTTWQYKEIKNINNVPEVRIVSADTNNVLDMGTLDRFVIKNNKAKIIFENLVIWAPQPKSILLLIENSNVEFKGCTFRCKNNVGTFATNILSLSNNARVVIDQNCTIVDDTTGDRFVKDISSELFIDPLLL